MESVRFGKIENDSINHISKYIFWFLSCAKGVRLGEWDQSTDPDCDEGNCADPAIDVPVIEQISHENFHDNEKYNDIALLRLARSVTFSTWIKPICLPITERAQNLNYIGYNFVVSGWGKVII